MGKKQEGKGKHFFLYSACLLIILLLSNGCGTFLNHQKESQKVNHLELAKTLISNGDYQGALREYEAAANLFPNTPPGDSALFQMGLTWAHPDNPQRNYKNALECFRRLVSNFPQSNLMNDARLWIGTVNELILSDIRIKELEGTLSALNIELAAQKKTELNIEEKNKILEENIGTLKKQINTLKETGLASEEKNRDLEETIKTLKNQLNALKEIDLGTEEKMRE